MSIAESIEKISTDWDFFEDTVVKQFTAFRESGQNIYGIRRREITRTQIIDPKKGKLSGVLELGPKGISETDFEPMRIHVTTSGTPHRNAHNFGFWHINDMDELYLPLPKLPGEEFGHFLVIMQTPKGKEGESFAWYCRDCLTLLFEHRYDSGLHGLAGFWKAEDIAVRAYNSEVKRRTCPECGTINPLGYAWNSAKDTPDQARAREIW